LSLGSPGGLAGNNEFNAMLLAAWAPNAKSATVSVGIALPRSGGGSNAITIMGPLKLNTGVIGFAVTEEGGYILSFRNVNLSFFGVKFPPGGAVNVLLFGNPEAGAARGLLGWYAAYQKDAEKKDEEKKDEKKKDEKKNDPKALIP
jgi:hypothetical protein